MFGYSTSEHRDEWTDRYESLFARLDSLAALADRDAAQRIAADDLDVLVDLSTHTKGARPGILALKPARVQITHVASAGTLAMSAIDFKLTDRYADIAPRPGDCRSSRRCRWTAASIPYRHVAPGAGGHRSRANALRHRAHAVVIGAFVHAAEAVAAVPRAVA